MSFRYLQLSQFDRTLRLIGIQIPAKSISETITLLKKEKKLLNIPATKPVIPSLQENEKIVLLDPSITESNLELLSEETKRKIHHLNPKFVEHNITLTYESMAADEMMKNVLPPNIPNVSAFETAGHIAHVNLLPEHEPYKHLLGEIIMAKNKGIRTVVNKTSNIASEFRTFPLEVIAGEDDLQTEVKELGCRYKFNYAKVYWNSRLGNEHECIVNSINKGDVVCDLFAGVGPFAIPLAKKGCTVYANDLNPESFNSLQTNIKLNRAEGKVLPFNKDARDMARFITNECIHNPHIYKKYSHVIMNLPALAVSFLDVFIKLFPRTWGQLPVVYCYGFASDKDPAAEILEMVKKILGDTVAEVKEVRDVSPHKRMMRVTFQLPPICYKDSDDSMSQFNDKRKSEFEEEDIREKKRKTKDS